MPFIDLSEPYIIDIGRGVAAVFKPCGWHSALHEPGDISVPSWLLEHGDLLPASELKTAVHAAAPRIRGDAVRNREKPDPFQDELGMLYRLDRDTSGILLFALDRSTMDSMRRAQNSMALQKRYMLACTESGRELPGAAPGSRQAERAVLLDRLRAGKEMEVASYFQVLWPARCARGLHIARIRQEDRRRSSQEISMSQSTWALGAQA
jgi:RNA pseudouridylate synthase.